MSDQLYNSNLEYDNGFQSQIPADINLDQAEDFFNSIGYEQEKIYSDFEEQNNFMSLRKKLEIEDEIWIESQDFPIGTEAEIGTSPVIAYENPHGFRIASSAGRVLYNSGAEVIVNDSENNPIIYKEFDWGTLKVKNMDIDLIRTINESNIKDYPSIAALIENNANASADIPNVTNCMTKANVERFYYSSVGQLSRARTHAYRPILTKKTRFSATSIGYLYKNGKWRRRSVWLQVGICGRKNNSQYAGAVALGECSQYMIVACVSRVPSKCKRSYETTVKSADTAHFYNDGVFSFHGQGTFTYTIDFYGTNSWGHEMYEISR